MSTSQLSSQNQYTLRLSPPRWSGPVAFRRICRALGVWAVLWVPGLFAVTSGAPQQLTAIALSLAMPGGGLIYLGHWLLFAAGLFVFFWSVFLWWATGPVLLPLAVWAGLALLPLSHEHHDVPSWTAPVVLWTPPALLACSFVAQVIRHRGQVRRGRDIDTRLARAVFTRPVRHAVPPVSESTPEDLAALRYALDLALQPIDRFDGFTKIDQFREAALRYQLTSIGYALATSQYTRTPAFSGYLAEAQRNAIEKVLDKRVWRYWAIENLWGNLRWNPDPIARDNIMLTGFYGVQVGMYESLNDDRYSRPGALSFVWDDRRVYANSLPTLAETVHRNAVDSAWKLFPCEPNWTYAVCNTFGLNTMLLHDRLHGATLMDHVGDQLREAYEAEFMRPDGRMVGLRNELLGLSWNFFAGAAAQLTTVFWANAGLTELAQRTWWILRDQELRDDGAGGITLPPSASSRVDAGNYHLGGEAFGQVMLGLAAREVGDEDVAVRAIEWLDTNGDPITENGARRYGALSTWGNLYALQSRFNRANGLHDLINHGAPEAWRTGPVLEEVAYPDVLVAQAVTDGQALELVLRPGDRPCRTVLRLARLVPNRPYRVHGALEDALIASSTGTATVTVDLGDRLEVRITPQ